MFFLPKILFFCCCVSFNKNHSHTQVFSTFPSMPLCESFCSVVFWTLIQNTFTVLKEQRGFPMEGFFI